MASIKPVEAVSANSVTSGQLRIGMTIDNAMVHITSMSLSDMLRAAYKIKTFQISGPDWLRTQRFDISAKMPAGSNRDQVPEMMQALLADRFKVALHRQTTDQQAFVLVVAKGGLKLKESAPETAASSTPGSPATPQAPTPADGGAQVRAAATSTVGGGVSSRSVNGNVNMTPSSSGTGMRVELTQMNTTGMTEFLSRFVDRPIVDKTDLQGRYDLTLDIGLEDLIALARNTGIVIPFAPSGDAARASDPGSSGVFTAIQAYGLKLEPRKVPVELLVIDHAEKMPTEN